MPAHCTSTGKALLSELPEEEVLRLYPDEELVQLTVHSIGTRSELLEELARIRHRGYSQSIEEAEEGVSSTQSPRLAINVSVPVSRMTDVLQEAVISRLAQAADELDHVLL
jgi:DNA-binding IclR family transcriptional regulator